jgi:hypothetical protein
VSLDLFSRFFLVFNRLWRREERCKDEEEEKELDFGCLLPDLSLAGKIRQRVLPWISMYWG